MLIPRLVNIAAVCCFAVTAAVGLYRYTAFMNTPDGAELLHRLGFKSPE